MDIPEPYKAKLTVAVLAAIGRGAMKPHEGRIHLNVVIDGPHSIYSLMGRLAIYKEFKAELSRINALQGEKPSRKYLRGRCREIYDQHIDLIRHAARECGYAIGVHGSIARDIDLIAAPWAEDAKTTTELLSAILAVIAPAGGYLPSDDWVAHMPQGRLAFPFYFPGDPHQPYIDLSVMPLATGPQADKEIRVWWDANETGRIERGSNKDQMEKTE